MNDRVRSTDRKSCKELLDLGVDTNMLTSSDWDQWEFVKDSGDFAIGSWVAKKGEEKKQKLKRWPFTKYPH